MKNIKRKQKKVSFLILFCIVAAPVIFWNPISIATAAEQDEEDNFTALPNWCWTNESTTDSDVQESLLGNDFYQIDAANLDPTDSMKFEKSRQLIDRDFYVDQKFQMELGGDETEYFRDIIGDPVDFTEGAEDDWGWTGSETYSDGLVYLPTTAGWSWLGDFSSAFVEPAPFIELFTRFDMRIYTATPISNNNLFVYLYSDYDDGTGNAYGHFNFGAIATGWSELSVDLMGVLSGYGRGWNRSQTLEKIVIVGSVADITITIDEIGLFGQLDYATFAKGEIEDTWDWEDSYEYYYDEEANVSDFNEIPEDYFYDTYTDLVDFEEGDVDYETGGAGVTDISVSDGWLVGSRASNDHLYFAFEGQSIPSTTYKYLKVKLNGITSGITSVEIFDSALAHQLAIDSTGWAANETFILTFNLSLSADWTGTEPDIIIGIIMSSVLSNNKGGLDWMYLMEGETSDQETWVADNNEILSNQNGWLSIRETAYSMSIFSTGLSIDASVYKWLTIEVEITSTAPQTELWYIQIRDDANHALGQVDYNEVFANGTRFLFSLDLDLDADWTGTETALEIRATFNDTGSPKFKEIAYNMVFLYDVELGDVEGFYLIDDDVGTADYEYVHPEGFISTWMTGTGGYDYLRTPDLGNFPYEGFKYGKMEFRFRAHDVSYVRVQAKVYSIDAGWVYPIISPTYYPSVDYTNGEWATIEFLPSDVADWNIGEDLSMIYIIISSSVNDYFDLDYLLWTTNFTSSPIKFSLLNQAHEESMYFKFSRNDPATNTYTFDIDFLDSVGIALHYSTTFLYSTDDGWLFLEFNLNINKKLFKILLEYENGTDIVKTRSMYALYGQIGTPNLLITKVGDPVYCMNMSQEPFGHAYVIIDYIDADWKILAWQHPSGTSPDLGLDAISDPYSFDQSFPADILNQYTLDFVGEIYDSGAYEKAYSWFYLDVDKFDGVSMDITGWGDNLESGDSLITRIFFANVGVDGSLDVLLMFKQSLKPTSQYGLLWFEDDGTRHVSDWVNGAGYEAESTLSVYMDTTNNELIAQARVDTGAGASETLGANVSRVEQLTEEMVIFVTYEYTDYAATAPDDEWKVHISGFDLIRKGWIEDIVASVLKGITDLLALAFSPFIMFFTWLLSGLVVLGRFIVDGLQPFFDALGAIFTAAIGGLQVAFGTIIDGLELALTTALGTLETAVDGITTALSNLAGQIWSAFMLLVDDLSALLEEIILGMVDWINDFYESLLNDWLFAMFDDLMLELGLTELVLFISDFVTDMLQVLGYVIGIASAFMGFMFKMGMYWLVPERLSAAGLAIFMIIMAWLFYPLLMLFILFVDGDFDSDEWITHVESFADKLFLVISTTMSILSYIVNFIIQALITIGGFIPFT